MKDNSVDTPKLNLSSFGSVINKLTDNNCSDSDRVPNISSGINRIKYQTSEEDGVISNLNDEAPVVVSKKLNFMK